MTLPFTEPGIRLIRRSQISLLDGRLKELRGELAEAARQLDAHYDELLHSARERLGSLFEASDYPPRLSDWFSMDWDYPSIQPPDYLRQLSPELYEQECRRVRARFEEAVSLAERAFVDEFSQLVRHLCERISEKGGRRQVFVEGAHVRLCEFFGRFRQLNIGSQPELDALVERAQAVVAGISPDDLQQLPELRQVVAMDLQQVAESLDALMVDRPRRRLIRPVPAEERS
jgi:hypothetical protein